MRHLEGSAKFFGVPPAYFFDDADAEKIDAHLAVLAAMRDADVRMVARHVGARVRRARTLHPALAPEAAGAFERAVDTLAPRR